MIPLATDSDRWVPSEDDSGTIDVKRHSLILALMNAIDDPTAAGDLALARLVTKLLFRILAADEPSTAEGLADLEE